MATVILIGVIVFMSMFLGRFMPWEHICRHSLSSFEIAFAVVFSISLPFTALVILHADWTASSIILAFWGLCLAAVLGAGLAALIDALVKARSRADDAEEREERLIKRVKK